MKPGMMGTGYTAVPNYTQTQYLNPEDDKALSYNLPGYNGPEGGGWRGTPVQYIAPENMQGLVRQQNPIGQTSYDKAQKEYMTPAMSKYPQAGLINNMQREGMLASLYKPSTVGSFKNDNLNRLNMMNPGDTSGVVAGTTYASPITGLTPEQQMAENAKILPKGMNPPTKR